MNQYHYDKLTDSEKNALYYLSLVPDVEVENVLKNGGVEEFRKLIKKIHAGDVRLIRKMTLVLDDEGIDAILNLECLYQSADDMVSKSVSF